MPELCQPSQAGIALCTGPSCISSPFPHSKWWQKPASMCYFTVSEVQQSGKDLSSSSAQGLRVSAGLRSHLVVDRRGVHCWLIHVGSRGSFLVAVKWRLPCSCWYLAWATLSSQMCPQAFAMWCLHSPWHSRAAPVCKVSRGRGLSLQQGGPS